jgi:uncharacterized protein (TIGR02145 family)
MLMFRYKKIFTSLFFIVSFFGLFTVFKKMSDEELKGFVKNPTVIQSQSIPGQPIKWLMKVDAQTISSGDHLVYIPKSADKVVISDKNTEEKEMVGTIDRQKLSEISKQIAVSEESRALSKILKKEAKEKSRQITAKNSLVASIFARVKNNIPFFIGVINANADDVLSPIQEIVFSNMEESVTPEVVVVDLTPLTPDVVEVGNVDTSTSTSTVDTTATSSLEDVTTSTSTEVSTSTETEVVTATSTTSTEISTNTITSTVITTETPSKDIFVEYETPAPIIAEAETETGKIVTISDSISVPEGQPHTTNVLAFTNIPPIYKVGQEDKIKIKWLNNNNQEMSFQAFDLNTDGKLDYVEWTVPHLSTQTFEIIFISKALELDQDKNIVGEVFDQVKEQNNIWASVQDGHYVRTTFEKFLTSSNDITVYVKPSVDNTVVNIEVYPVYDGIGSDQPIAVFEPISHEGMYKVLLNNLISSTDVFDIKITGSADIDYIVDPTPVTVTDTYTDLNKIASMMNVTLDSVNGQITLSTLSSWTCGSALLDSRDGKIYNTVLIGAQCWMQQNLNVGTMVTGVTTQGSSCASIQKYCYSNSEASCSANGGLYQWNQAMCGSVSPGAQGVCPVGWHVPTHDEFTILERTTCTSGTCTTDFPYDTSTTGYRGTNEGTTLKNMSGLYRGMLSGGRSTDGSFFNLGVGTYFWSSVPSGTSAWYRYLYSGNAGVRRGTYDKAYGVSIRCIKD